MALDSMSDEEILSLADPDHGQSHGCATVIDHERHMRDFSDRRRPGAAAIIWKQWFAKAHRDFVAEMLLVEKDGAFLVDHVMIF